MQISIQKTETKYNQKKRFIRTELLTQIIKLVTRYYVLHTLVYINREVNYVDFKELYIL